MIVEQAREIATLRTRHVLQVLEPKATDIRIVVQTFQNEMTLLVRGSVQVEFQARGVKYDYRVGLGEIDDLRNMHLQALMP